jgi:hypothetical protein
VAQRGPGGRRGRGDEGDGGGFAQTGRDPPHRLRAQGRRAP